MRCKKHRSAVVTLRDSPCGDMSNAATVAVMTCDVSLQMETKKLIFIKFVANLHSSTARVCFATSSTGAHLVLANLVALLVD
jgi:hypothetical protein